VVGRSATSRPGIPGSGLLPEVTDYSVVLPWCLFSCVAKFWLALALLVTWVLADDHDSTVAANDLALVANLLDARVYLHVSNFFLGLLLADLFVSVSDSATR
jgi:hypothetical protein